MNIRTGIFLLLFGLAAGAVVFSPALVYGEETLYTVQRGETLYSIAQVFGIKAETLMQYNGITDPSRLRAGQRLKIPNSAPAPVGRAGGGFTSYRAVRGDTLYSIARKFSVTVSSILEANSLSANYLLKEGDSLRIPSGNGNLMDAIIPPSTAAAAQAPMPANTPAAPQSADQKDASAGKVDPSVRWPVAAQELSYMTGKLSGVMITGARAEPVRSLTWGTVLSAGPYRGFGKVIIVQVEGGYLYVYGGCESLSVKEGDKVGPGTELGKLGADVVTNKPQLFFMVYRSNTPIDPAKAPRA